jgi:hypothetical protein
MGDDDQHKLDEGECEAGSTKLDLLEDEVSRVSGERAGSKVRLLPRGRERGTFMASSLPLTWWQVDVALTRQ